MCVRVRARAALDVGEGASQLRIGPASWRHAAAEWSLISFEAFHAFDGSEGL
jgi:hypothetical protein